MSAYIIYKNIAVNHGDSHASRFEISYIQGSGHDVFFITIQAVNSLSGHILANFKQKNALSCTQNVTVSSWVGSTTSGYEYNIPGPACDEGTIARFTLCNGTNMDLYRPNDVEGPLPRWDLSLMKLLAKILRPLFSPDHDGEVISTIAYALGFPCVEIPLGENRSLYPYLPLVRRSNWYELRRAVRRQGIFPRDFVVGQAPPFSMDLEGKRCYACECEGTLVLVPAEHFNLDG
jgi:hypothetical protein